MSAANLQTLTVLLERAEAERDEAMRAFQEAQQRASHARDQHGQLAQYRSDYQTRWTQTFAQRGTMDIVGCYQTFGLRLNQAIDQQHNVSSYADQRANMAREQLHSCELRVASIKKLLDRRRLEARQRVQRQEQKATDEMAARLALSSYSPFTRLSA